MRALAALVRGPGLSSQHPHSSSELSITPVLKETNALFWSLWTQSTHVNNRGEKEKGRKEGRIKGGREESPMSMPILVGGSFLTEVTLVWAK